MGHLGLVLLAGILNVRADSFPISWTNSYDGGLGADDVLVSAAVDQAGNLIMAGNAAGTNGVDVLTMKCAPDGSLLWMARYDSLHHRDDTLKQMAVDSHGHPCLCLQSMTTNGDSDIILLKYDPSGPLLWEYRYNGTGFSNDVPAGFDLDASDDLYVGGTSVGTNGAGKNMITFKCSATGSNLWEYRFASPKDSNQAGECFVNDLACDSTGQVYQTGGYHFHSDYAKSLKFSPEGAVLWDISLGSKLVINELDELFLVEGSILRKVNPTNAATIWQSAPTLPYNSSLTIKRVMFNPAGAIYLAGDYNQTKKRYAVVALDAGGTQRWYNVLNVMNLVSGHQQVYGACKDPFTNIVVVGNIGFLAYTPTGLEAVQPRDGLTTFTDILSDTNGYIYVVGSQEGAPTGSDFAAIKLAPNPPDDLDGDGLPNWWESTNFGDLYAGVAANDDDEDGWSNIEEYSADSVPTNALSGVPEIASIGTLATPISALVMNTSTARTYDVLAQYDLLAADSWSVITATQSGNGNSLMFSLTNQLPWTFYRLRVRVP